MKVFLPTMPLKLLSNLPELYSFPIFPFSSEDWTATTRLPGGKLLSSLSDCFNELVRLIGAGLSQLTYVIKYGLEVKYFLSFFLSDSVLASYKR